MPPENTIDKNQGRQILTGFFQSPLGGEKIYYKRSISNATETSAKHLVIVPNIGEYHGRHTKLPEYLQKKWGNSTNFTWLDLKGHGLSGGTRGHVDNFEEYCHDLICLLNKLPASDEYILLGSGVGCLVILKTLLEFRNQFKLNVVGLVMSNPAIKMKVELSSLFLKIPPNQALKKLKIPHRIDGYELTNDTLAAEEFNHDPLVNHTISANLYWEL
mgnify:FL=1